MLISLILFVLVVLGLIVAFAAYVMVWIVMIVFGVTTVILALLVQDPYLGFFLAFPVTGMVLRILSLMESKSGSTQD